MTPAPILCERIRTPPLDPAFLKPTRWATVEEKAKLGNAMLRFIAEGMPAEKFTASLYERLSNMFGFIAHYDRHGFAQTWFDSAATRRDFLDQIVRHPCWGDPGFVWSDVEREIGQRVRENLLVEAWASRAREDQNAREKAELARLMAKHGVASVSPVVAAPAVQLGLF
ncbi:hypothetical protein CFR75_12295 [Komagataeibacter xylinus]|uniref:Uncharacterized protein n=1 Tax=Komagataeibacter xylinus TaxID=28448 RepID=A0A318PG54_KOMXY|nr:hypothetical protein [Komagataeibacter xylinus]PYD56200.1 hypothetical protein CFR75_12295 [Komagataeibacter xylinus]GBQ67954.1 hypothetical protein AA15237_0280 [Komagataeibacter xylinus NBRC 15237]